MNLPDQVLGSTCLVCHNMGRYQLESMSLLSVFQGQYGDHRSWCSHKGVLMH